MTALARHLQARNHEVVFLYSSSANGLPYVPGDKDDADKDQLLSLERSGRLKSLDNLDFVRHLSVQKVRRVSNYIVGGLGAIGGKRSHVARASNR